MISKKKSYDMNYLKESDINNNRCTIEKIQRLSPYLHRNNPELYKLYLASTPDLGDNVKEHYLNIMNKLKSDEDKQIEEALKIYKDVSEYYE